MATPTLDSFANPAGARGDVRTPPLPKLAPLVREHGLLPGCDRFDDQMERWRADLQRQIQQALSAAVTPTPTGAP